MATSQCDCETQDPRSFVHFVHIGQCSKQSDGLDSWHYTGNKAFHSDPVGAKFLALCKDKLQQRQLPIKLGSTGYIDFPDSLLAEPNGWCKDELGRTVILLNGALMFQRMLEGEVIMQKKLGPNGWNQLGHEEMASLAETLTKV